MKVYFSNNGCSIEGEDFLRFLRLTQAEQVYNIFSADVIVARFCGMSTESFEKIPQYMAYFEGLKIKNPKLKLYIGGCAAEVLALKIRYPFVDGVFRRRSIVEDLSSFFNYNPLNDTNPISFFNAVRIQSGCMRKCGFCKQGYMNMPLKSKTINQVVQDIEYAVSKGFHFINLLSENSTEYGMDLPEKVRLIDLLRRIERIEDVTAFSLSGLCMDELIGNKELVAHIKNSKKIFQVQIEIQSLIPQVRKNMRLASTVEEVLKLLQEVSGKSIVTNIMLGYPGENDKNFKEQISLIRKLDMYYVQINVFDNTPHTYAYSLEQIPKAKVKQRESALLKVIESLRKKKAKELIRISKSNPIPCVYMQDGIALLQSYSAAVHLKSCLNLVNGQLIQVRITGLKKALDVFDGNQSMILEGELDERV